MSIESDDFEKEVIERLRKKGYWAIRLPSSTGGQPFDILALGNMDTECPLFIECKVCANDRFDFRRIEDNQLASMMSMNDYGIMFFAIRFKSGINIISADFIRNEMNEGKKSIVYNEHRSILNYCLGY